MKQMDDNQEFEKTLVTGDEEQLNELKSWLFQENIRLENGKLELRNMEEKFNAERTRFQTEMREVNQRLVIERKRLKQDELFFEKKMDILRNGFAQLDEERRALEKERIQLSAEKSAQEKQNRSARSEELAEMLFQGVNSQLALKKRYKDLLKMFHPDNIAGDTEMVIVINRVYEILKQEYEFGRWA